MALEKSDLDQLKSTLSQLDERLQAADGTADQSDLLALRQDLVELIAIQEEQLLYERKNELLKQLESHLLTCSDDVGESMPDITVTAKSTAATEELRNALIGQRCSVKGWTVSGQFVRQNAVISDVVDSAVDSDIQTTSPSLVETAGRVRVFLTHPTRTTDLPCEKFVTDGFCHRGIRCPWSHGKVVSSEDIDEWDEPDANLYTVEGQPCLVKENPHSLCPSIWKHAHLLHTDPETETCVIQWGHRYHFYLSEQSNKNKSHASLIRPTGYEQLDANVASVPLHAVWPLTREQSDEDDESVLNNGDKTLSTDSDSSSCDEMRGDAAGVSQSAYRARLEGSSLNNYDEDLQIRYGDPRPKVSFVPGGVLSPEDILRAMPYSDPVGLSQFEKDQHSSQMGSWETHTRGIGSRLLAKMGYIGQGGLGVHGNGRLVPVAILLEKFQILPRGWNHRPSLDRLLQTAGCSHKRSSRDKRRTSHSRTTVDRKGVESASVRQPYLFQFINSALRQHMVGDKEPCSSVSSFQSKPQEILRLKKDCQLDPASSEFRVQVFRTHEEISRTKQQIHRARESIERNQGRDKVVTKQAEQRLIMLQAQLDQLRNHERTLQQSKNKHSTEKKLRIF